MNVPKGSDIDNTPSKYFTPQKTGLDQLVNISQRKIGDDYVFKISINGETKHEVQNSNPRDFEKVEVYISDNWHDPIDDGDILVHHIKIYQWA